MALVNLDLNVLLGGGTGGSCREVGEPRVDVPPAVAQVAMDRDIVDADVILDSSGLSSGRSGDGDSGSGGRGGVEDGELRADLFAVALVEMDRDLPADVDVTTLSLSGV